jgi:drug/metabolite transporter (DMT)-like permease
VVYVNVNPMVAIILGAVLLAEKLTGIFVVGLVTVGAGVLFVNWPRRIESE